MTGPSYYRGLTVLQLAAWITGVGGAIGVVTTGVVKGKAWVDAHYVTVAAYQADREAYRAKRFADSVHHAADDEVNARVALAVDSIEHPHRRPRVLQAGEPR